jgi:hypothetical protein
MPLQAPPRPAGQRRSRPAASHRTDADSCKLPGFSWISVVPVVCFLWRPIPTAQRLPRHFMGSLWVGLQLASSLPSHTVAGLLGSYSQHQRPLTELEYYAAPLRYRESSTSTGCGKISAGHSTEGALSESGGCCRGPAACLHQSFGPARPSRSLGKLLQRAFSKCQMPCLYAPFPEGGQRGCDFPAGLSAASDQRCPYLSAAESAHDRRGHRALQRQVHALWRHQRSSGCTCPGANPLPPERALRALRRTELYDSKGPSRPLRDIPRLLPAFVMATALKQDGSRGLSTTLMSVS